MTTSEIHELMQGYQISGMSSKRSPGIADYLQKIIDQNDKIVEVLLDILQEIK